MIHRKEPCGEKREWESNPQSRDFKSRRYSGLRTAPTVSRLNNSEPFELLCVSGAALTFCDEDDSSLPGRPSIEPFQQLFRTSARCRWPIELNIVCRCSWFLSYKEHLMGESNSRLQVENLPSYH